LQGEFQTGFANSGITDSTIGDSFLNIRTDNIAPTSESNIKRNQRFGRNEPLIIQTSINVRKYVTLLASNAACSAMLPRAGLIRAILPTEKSYRRTGNDTAQIFPTSINLIWDRIFSLINIRQIPTWKR